MAPPRRRSRPSARPCRTPRASTSSRTRRARSSTWARPRSIRKRVAGALLASRRRPRLRRHGLPDRRGRLHRHGDRGRGAAHRAALHPPAPAALQRPPARRQVLPVHRDLAGRGLPARLLHARAAPAQPRVLRARSATPSACARRSTCSGKIFQHRTCDGPEPGRASGSPCLDYYIKRCQAPCVGYISKEEYRENIDTIIDFLSGRYRQIERGARGGDEARGGGAGVRAGGQLPQPAEGGALAARAPADLERGGGHARRHRGGRRGHRRQRAGLPGARRRAGRPPELLPRERRPPRRGRGGRGVRAPVLRAARWPCRPR